MSYKEAMEIAGATVKKFKNFGSYQGEWWALVKHNGRIGWVNGSYGSCSECDAFESEFGYSYHTHIDNEYYDPMYNGFVEDCKKCQDVKSRLISFGESYLERMMKQKKAVEMASRNLSWDFDAQEMVNFIVNHDYRKS